MHKCLHGLSNEKKQMSIKSHKNSFLEMKKKSTIINTQTEMTIDNPEDDELSLWNPYSRITCFILYLYSMEFGQPPLYAELNRVCREMDLS